MTPYETPPPAVLILFGAGGDLTWRKLVPALYSLFVEGWMPAHFAIVGVDRRALDEVAFRDHLRAGTEGHARQPFDEASWARFAERLRYLSADFSLPATFEAIRAQIEADEATWGAAAVRLFYLATPPTVVGMVASGLHAAGLHQPPERSRLVVEKPFGHDLPSARAVNAGLLALFEERQLFRIDHYLGKETVQNLLAFRFANLLWEPIWDRRYIDHVQITVAESVGVEERGGYYDRAGALRDMVQNHLLQLLTLMAMEPMVSFDADEIRDKKLDVLQAIRPIQPHEAEARAVRGQYVAGHLEGEALPGYLEESDIPPGSITESFVALKLHIDNWRWQGVPFYLRTGKRLPYKDSEIVVQLRPVPHSAFPSTMAESCAPNQLVIHLQPDEGIDLRFRAKQPGPTMTLGEVDLNFRYAEDFPQPLPDAYETLLLDVLLGDATLFMRADQVEAAWAVVQPLLDHWAAGGARPEPYEVGSWGPAAADALLARDGRGWVLPV